MNDKRQRVLAQANDLAARGRIREAIDLFELLAEAGNDGNLWNTVAHLYKAERAYEQAVDAFDRALACGVDRAEDVHVNRGGLSGDYLRRTGRAEKDFRAALALVPDYPPAMLALGMLQEQRGESKRALATYEHMLAAPPDAHPGYQPMRIEALARSARLRPATSANDPLLMRLHRAAEGQTDKAMRAKLLFALGHSQEQVGAYEPAFETYVRANRWAQRSSGIRHDRARTRQAFQALIAATQTPIVAGLDAFAGHRAEPLFICGHFRSGCALLERALAAHPQITAAGPIMNLRRLVQQIAPFPSSLATLAPERAAELAKEYRANLATLFPKGIRGGYVVDSRPDNFMLIGMIKLLFPGAKIVHTARNPLDNGIAIFAHRLPLQVADYSGDLGDIGHYLGMSQRLISHYKQLYPESIIDVDYDAFVADPVNRLAALLDELNLPWDDKCLPFLQAHTAPPDGKRGRATSETLHDQLSGRWQRFTTRLDPLRAELHAAGLIALKPPLEPPAAPARASFN